MSMQDPLADMLTRIRNAQMAGIEQISMNVSKTKAEIAKVLRDEGFVESFEVDGEVKKTLTIELKYLEGKPVIEHLQRESRPGLRLYRGKDDIPQLNGGLGVYILSTNKGVMTDRAARSAGVGGEILCSVF
ncbi:MAG: 30S ribosomal protein S8 [Gammaproteobacteria bacterium]|nr:30S ribosomal protein S8 [Gammaproteobacteria bacterium]OUU05938.1 MAG: 30S ribosomal protein S8 [Gammaproteobacteria bacterium TMED34]|tara:strand:- start:232 stop:624 length:393 start_codon:yes stop_codon:yes gene_type:complete